MGFRTAFACLVLVGCGVTDPEELDAPDNVARVKICSDPIYCTTNSPVFGVYKSFDFNLDGALNAQDISLLGFSYDNFYNQRDILTLNVSGSRIIGTDKKGNTVEHASLLGAKIWVQLGDGTQGSITISDVGQYPEAVWTLDPKGNPERKLIETYVLNWAPVLQGGLPGPIHPGDTVEWPQEGAAKYLCEEVRPDDWHPEDLGLPYFFESTVFEGDRFDPIGKTVDPTPQPRWFNIGCGKHLLAKLRLTRNTTFTSNGGWQAVQAATKMFSADYCGTGKPYTVPGTPILWRDRQLVDYARPASYVEARWSAGGALCLDEPRLAARRSVEKACNDAKHALPLCKNSDPNAGWEKFELVTSAFQ